MKRNIKAYTFIVGVLALSLFLLTSCTKEENKYDQQARDAFYQLMKEWYLWYDEMPSVNLEDYDNAQDLLEDIRKDLDLWSYITTKEEYEQYYKAGEYIGFGFGYLLFEGSFYISFVYSDSPLAAAGVKRGWKIRKINQVAVNDYATFFAQTGEDEVGLQRTFEFEKPDGSTVTQTFAKKVITMNSVIHLDTLHVSGKVVGHMVLKSFIGPTIEELDTSFRYFSQHQIEELILDLRYNGGGRLDVTTQLVSLIAGPSLKDQPFLKITYNDKKQSENETVVFLDATNRLDLPVDYPASLQRLIVLTTAGTASASEAVINGLDPYINVVSIGDYTYGKPVGMNAWYWDNYYAFVPVTFKLANADDYGDYFGGIPADSYIPDVPTRDFSDREEGMLKEAIYYLETGSFTFPGTMKSRQAYSLPPLRGLNSEIGAIK